jgi:hypothetical protein
MRGGTLAYNKTYNNMDLDYGFIYSNSSSKFTLKKTGGQFIENAHTNFRTNSFLVTLVSDGIYDLNGDNIANFDELN